MPIQVTCGRCRTECAVHESLAGREIPCPRCMAAVRVPGPPPLPQAPEPAPVLNVLDEELGAANPAQGGGAIDPWAGHGHSRKFRLTNRTGITVAAVGIFALFVLLVLLLPKAGIVFGWLIALASAAGAFASICWLIYGLSFLPPHRRQSGESFLGFLASLGAGGIAAGGIAYATYLVDWRANPEKYAARAAVASASPSQQDSKTPSGTASPDGKSGTTAAPPAAAKGGQKPAGGPGQPQTPGKPKEDEDIPPNPDLISFDPPKFGKEPAKRIVQPLPPPDPNANPLETAYEEASRNYTTGAAVNLLASDDEAFKQKMLWFTLENRPAMGFRWGLGVQTAGQSSSPDAVLSRDVEKQAGAVGLAVATGLNKRIAAGVFGDWPEADDFRLRQVALLKNGRQEDLLAAAKRQCLDMLVAVDPIPAPPVVGAGPPPPIRVHVIAVGEDRVLATFPPSGSKLADPVAGLAEQVIKFLDDNCTLKPIPWLINDPARQRIAKLNALQPKSETALSILLEARYYQIRQLLPADQASRLYNAVLGAGNGDAFAGGDGAKRREVLEAWLKGG